MSEFDQDDVYHWLLNLKLRRPLEEQWQMYQLDPVEELYQNANIFKPMSISIWISVAMAFILICIFIVAIFSAKVPQWFSVISKNENRAADTRIYEEAVDKLSEVHIYEGGKRIGSAPAGTEFPTTSLLAMDQSDSPDTLTSTPVFPQQADTRPPVTLYTPTQSEHSITATSGKGNKLKSIFETFSSNFRQCRRQKSQQNISKHNEMIRAFQNRSLPSVLEQDIQSEREKSPFLQGNIFTPNSELNTLQRKRIKQLVESKRGADIHQVEQVLVSNSFEDLNDIINYKHRHAFSEIITHRPTPKNECQDEEIDMRSIRSQSMDDEYLSYNSKNRPEKIRQYRPQMSSEDNVTINEIYSENNEVDKPTEGDVGTSNKNRCLPLPYDTHSRESNSRDDELCCGNIVEGTNNSYNTITSIKEIDNIVETSNPYNSIKDIRDFSTIDVKKPEHTYAKIEDIPIKEKARFDIQKRPIPIPVELQMQDINDSLVHDKSLPTYEKIGGYEDIEKYMSFTSGSSDDSCTGTYMKVGEIFKASTKF